MKINLTEMQQIKSRLENINLEMKNILKSINSEFYDISNNINSAKLNNSIKVFQNNITILSDKFSQNMDNLETFISRQISSYSTTNERIKQSLINLIAQINGTFDERLTRVNGVFKDGPSGKETFYNLNMNTVVGYMRDLGFSEEEYPYWVREDGAKMLGDYIMVAADLNIRPRGTIIDTSLGKAIVCDTGSFVETNPEQVDIAVDWTIN